MSKFKTALLAALIAGGMPEMTLPDYGDAIAKGKPAKGVATGHFNAAAGKPKPPKLTPIFNATAGKPKPPTKPDKPVLILKPKGPTLTPGG